MYSDDTTPVEHVEVAHQCTGDPHDQVSRRPQRSRTPIRIGYARTVEAQQDQALAVTTLRNLNVDTEHIYIDRGDAALTRNRPQLAAALTAAAAGDVFVVADLVSLARSHNELVTLTQRLQDAQIHLEVGGVRLDQIEPQQLVTLSAEMETRLITETLQEQARYDAGHLHEERGARRKLSP